MLRVSALTLCVLAAAACSQPAQVEAPDSIAAVAGADVPADVVAAAQAVAPGFTVSEAERKERDGRVYYDVEGLRADGAEIELDILQTEQGWRVVEVQREIAWSAAPASVRTVAEASPGAFTPVRVIESVQTEDSAVIYELFAEGRPEAPSMEVRVDGSGTRVMTQANPH
ncbi:MAG TPA: hypothetical protein VEA80_19190 [Vitreimonas sp.]|uniref:hypothetical protein n=1 Tax=Vitreimonas sp. TaxID=3069702 RepID=UPI002D346E87|nr:hypothetical protein [Vitreimonas sp.]HYD89614.1 hypothetical protein [Vitreimonas sp.]